MAATNLVFHLASAAVLLVGCIWILRLQKRNRDLHEVLTEILTGKSGRLVVSSIGDVIKWAAHHMDVPLHLAGQRNATLQLKRINRTAVLAKLIQWSVLELAGKWSAEQKLELVLLVQNIPTDALQRADELAQLLGQQVQISFENVNATR